MFQLSNFYAVELPFTFSMLLPDMRQTRSDQDCGNGLYSDRPKPDPIDPSLECMRGTALAL